jgi:hypothetical protein
MSTSDLAHGLDEAGLRHHLPSSSLSLDGRAGEDPPEDRVSGWLAAPEA